MIGILMASALCNAALAQDALREAEERYARGDAAGAADAYETAIAEGTDNADVFFNVGTAALRAGDIGRAVWGLLEARSRDPWDDNVHFNLELAQKQNVDTLVGHENPAWIAALLFIPRAPLQWFAFAVFLAFCAFLTLRGVIGAQPTVEQWATRTGAASVAFGLLVLTVEIIAGAPSAVVMEKETVVRSTERADGPEAFRVHAGLAVRAVGQPRDGLLRIRLSNGLEGYVEETALRMVGGPPRLQRGPGATRVEPSPTVR